METTEIVALVVWLAVWIFPAACELSEEPEKRDDGALALWFIIGWVWPLFLFIAVCILGMLAIYSVPYFLYKKFMYYRGGASCLNQS